MLIDCHVRHTTNFENFYRLAELRCNMFRILNGVVIFDLNENVVPDGKVLIPHLYLAEDNKCVKFMGDIAGVEQLVSEIEPNFENVQNRFRIFLKRGTIRAIKAIESFPAGTLAGSHGCYKDICDEFHLLVYDARQLMMKDFPETAKDLDYKETVEFSINTHPREVKKAGKVNFEGMTKNGAKVKMEIPIVHDAPDFKNICYTGSSLPLQLISCNKSDDLSYIYHFLVFAPIGF